MIDSFLSDFTKGDPPGWEAFTGELDMLRVEIIYK